jgi:hypothetical protein
MLRHIAIFALAMSAAPMALAGSHFDHCGLDSDWSLKLSPASLSFEREIDGNASRIELSDGRLTVDGRTVELDGNDRRHLRDYESRVRALVPEAKAIALDAIAIAFTAVDEVARAFAGKDEAGYARTAEKLATARITARRHVEEAFEGRGWNDDQVEDLVEQAVQDLVPVLVGEIVSTAVRVALSGDEKAAAELDARAKHLEREIERKVEGRAKELERRAEALCPQLVELDHIEAQLSAELAPGQRFDLIQVDH